MNNSTQTGINRIIKQTDYQFTMIPNQAVRDPEMTSNAFRLLSYLLSHENGYELVYDQIMRQTDLGKYAIQKAIALLTEKGFLKVEQSRTPEGYWAGHNYILLDPYKETEVESPVAGQSVAESFGSGTTSPLKEDNLTKNINTKENKERDSLDERLEEFLAIYPKKGDAKKPIRQKLEQALKVASFEEILEGAKRYAQFLEWSDQYVAMAKTWLNQERWTEEHPQNPDKVKRDNYQKSMKVEYEYTQRQLAEMKEMEDNAVAPPKCKHDKTLALCPICVREL